MSVKQKIVVSNIIALSTILFAFLLLTFKLGQTSVDITSNITIDDVLFMATPAIVIISVIGFVNILIGYVIVYKFTFIAFDEITYVCSRISSHIKTLKRNYVKIYKEICVFRC
jgi:hypothetical protein